MKAISILVLLCSAASTLEEPTCITDSAAAKIAVDHINEHHHHGYKFKQTEVELYETDVNEELCTLMKLRLNLTETKCHVINPKSYVDCESREMGGTTVVANCNVEIQVKENEGSVNKYDCVTKKVPADTCPDCPVLISLTDQMGQSSVSNAVTEYNKNPDNDHYYVLKETGRIAVGYMFQAGTGYFAEFVLVETHCPSQSRIMPEACQPLCPDRARHAFCKSTYTTVNGLASVECEVYPAKDTSVLEKEPVCPRPQGPPGGPPPLARPGGPPPDASSGGPPPHAHGVQPPPCTGLAEYDHALHPICPWPVPEIPQNPRPSDS